MASQRGLVTVASCAAYCAPKAAEVDLTRAVAIEHAADGIRANGLCPRPTDTPMPEGPIEQGANPDAEHQRLVGTQLHGRFIHPSEIADAIAWLASPNAGSTSGTALVVGGA